MAQDATGLRNYAGAAVQATLSAGITNLTATFSISPSTNWPATNFIITVDPNTASEEKMLCASLSAGTITVTTRGYDGTTGVAHSTGAVVIHSISAIDISEANQIANVHAQTAKATPVGADEIPLFDSAASFGLKKLTWTQLLATIPAITAWSNSAVAASVSPLVTRTQYFITTSSPWTMTANASPTQGDEIRLFDVSGQAATNNVTFNPNGKNFQGSIQNLILAYNNFSITLIYTGTTYGWKVA